MFTMPHLLIVHQTGLRTKRMVENCTGLLRYILNLGGDCRKWPLSFEGKMTISRYLYVSKQVQLVHE